MTRAVDQMPVEPHGKYATSTLLASSAGLGWSTLFAELRSHRASEIAIIARKHLEIGLAVTGNEKSLIRRTGAGQRQETFALTGTTWLSPPEVSENVLSISAPIPKVMHVYLPTTLFARLREDFNLPTAPTQSIRYVAGIRDSVMNSILLSILSEMTTKTSVGRMYVETASLMLAAHLMSRYSDSEVYKTAITVSSKADETRIRHVLDFISDRVADQITLAVLADVAGLSTFHFARMFKNALGVSPHRYVSRLRLENAMTEIAAGKLSLAQIALNAGFSSQASFTRAFFRATGVTPGEYRHKR
jgi:AraC family transcriptional regulator